MLRFVVLGAFLRVASYSDYEGGLDEGVGSAVTWCHNARALNVFRIMSAWNRFGHL